METLLDTLTRMEIEAAWLQAQIARLLASLDEANAPGVLIGRVGQRVAAPTPESSLRGQQARTGACRFPLAA